jgi:CRISPR/Cas system-associated protein Cas10 (large subunit of type III CRISPR-Cas system)
MPRISVTFPQPLYDKLLKQAGSSDDSLSYTVIKMTELGMMVSESQEKSKNPEDRFSDIEKHCFKLMIQMNALLKNMASKQLDYGQDEFKKLMDLSVTKYHELMGIKEEEL